MEVSASELACRSADWRCVWALVGASPKAQDEGRSFYPSFDQTGLRRKLRTEGEIAREWGKICHITGKGEFTLLL